MHPRLRSILTLAPLLALCGSLLVAPTTTGAATATGSFQDAPPDTARMLQPDDLFRYHRVGDVRFAPDGEALAYELARPGEEGAIKRLPQHMDARSDLWIAAGPDAEPRRLTDGASEGIGWFHPRWSPDGEHLAFLSVDGNEVRAWLWKRGTHAPRALTDRPVHLTNVGPLLFRWVSSDKLALGLRPTGADASGRMLAEQTRPGLYAAQAREASWSGREVTADVLGGPSSQQEPQYLPRTELVLVGTDGSTRRAAEGRWAVAVPSPDGQWVATLSDVPVGSVNPDRSLRRKMTFARRPGVAPLTASDDASGSTRTSWEALDDPLPRTLRWAPDGSAFAVLTRPVGSDGQPTGVRVAVGRPGAESMRLVGDAAMRIEGFTWTGNGTLLVEGRRTGDTAESNESHWWQPPTDENDEWQNWTAGMETVPRQLVAVPEGAAGLVNGTLWRFIDGDREPLFQPEGGTLRRLVRPTPPFSPGPAPPQPRSPADPLRMFATGADGPALWSVQTQSGEVQGVRRLPMPRGARRPSDVAPDGSAAAFAVSNDDGTWLWRGTARTADTNAGSNDPEPRLNTRAAVDTVVATDQWLQNIERPEAQKLTYTGPQGDEQTAWILLPPGETPDGGYPTVTWFYPGRVHGDRAPRYAQLNGYHVTSGIGALPVFASQGYAVLLPSVPSASDDSTARPALAEALIPAVDRAADNGWTDPSRVGVIGHSYGGFGVNHLVSQTGRFEAAVASASFSHLRSFYGTFDARARYEHMGHPLALQLFTNAYLETGQAQMGAPPVRAPERYREASPLTYVDEVNTPLLLIHGTQDFVPIQQAEMFLTELLRLGKEAQMVRYAGEGHTLSGRANVLDMWDRIFAWFDRHLGDPQANRERIE